jgi:hypothetical protein
MSLWECSQTNNARNPKKGGDRNNVQSPSEDNTSVEGPIIESTDLQA